MAGRKPGQVARRDQSEPTRRRRGRAAASTRRRSPQLGMQRMRKEVPEPCPGRIPRLQVAACGFLGVDGGACAVVGGGEAEETSGIEGEVGGEEIGADGAGETG